jgi:hypothetical protein
MFILRSQSFAISDESYQNYFLSLQSKSNFTVPDIIGNCRTFLQFSPQEGAKGGKKRVCSPLSQVGSRAEIDYVPNRKKYPLLRSKRESTSANRI